MYKITLADGKIIDNLELNGTNFISDVKIDENIFTNNLSTVTFTHTYQEEIIPEGEILENYKPVFETKEVSRTHHDMKFIQQVHYDDGWYFILARISEEEKKVKADAQLRADVDFISIMTGVDL